MNFLALLLGLGVERLLTHLFHLREFRWLDPLFDRVFERLLKARPGVAAAGIIGLVVLTVFPVALAAVLLDDAFVQVPFFIFAVIVLLFSLGPRDLAEEVSDYCGAIEQDDPANIERTSKEMLEQEPPADPTTRAEDVQQAIYIQANNRVFGVVMWFVLLGPTGAWLFRVLDMMRRRAAYQGDRLADSGGQASIASSIQTLHGIFAWLPSRFMIIGYALAGNFDGAVQAWRDYYATHAERFFDPSIELIGRVGEGALGKIMIEGAGIAAKTVDRAKAAMSLNRRTLWLIWCPILALLTLYDWLS